MRVSGASPASQNGVYYLHTDHPSTALRAGLGSTTLVTTGEDRVGLPAGSVWTRQLYAPYGVVRYAYSPYGPTPTDYGYTGQRATDLGLMDYRARFYAPSLGRFVSADTVAPGMDGQALNRYMYVGGNPLRFSDPTGHWMNQVMHDYDDYQLVPIWVLRVLLTNQQGQVKGQRVVMNYLANVVQHTTGLSPAPGVVVVYGGSSPFYINPDGSLGGVMLGLNPEVDLDRRPGGDRESYEDEHVYIFEDAFYLPTTADLVGIAVEEICHSVQEYEIEGYNGVSVWERAVACSGANCPDNPTAGMRYEPGMEVEALNIVLSSRSSLDFSGDFEQHIVDYREDNWARIRSNRRFYYPPGTRYPPGNRNPMGWR